MRPFTPLRRSVRSTRAPIDAHAPSSRGPASSRRGRSKSPAQRASPNDGSEEADEEDKKKKRDEKERDIKLFKEMLQACTAGSIYDAVNFNCPVRIRRASAVVVLQLALTFGTLAAARVHFTAAASNDVARGNLTYANHTTPTCPGAAGAAGALDSKLAVSTSAHFTILVLTVVLMMWVRSDIVAAKRCLWIRTRETRVFGGLLLALVFSVLWGNMKAAQWTFESGGSHFDAILNGLVLLFILDLDEKCEGLLHGFIWGDTPLLLLEEEAAALRAAAAGEIEIDEEDAWFRDCLNQSLLAFLGASEAVDLLACATDWAAGHPCHHPSLVQETMILLEDVRKVWVWVWQMTDGQFPGVHASSGAAFVLIVFASAALAKKPKSQENHQGTDF